MGLKAFIIRLSTFIGGLYFVLYFLTPQSILSAIGVQAAHEYITTGFILVGSAAFGIGIINITLIHLRKIFRMREGWSYSAALLSGLIVMVILASLDWRFDLRSSAQFHRWQVLSQFAEAIGADQSAQRQDVPPVQIRIEALTRAVSQEIAAARESLNEPYPETVNASHAMSSKELDELYNLTTNAPLLDSMLGEYSKKLQTTGQAHQIFLAAKKREELISKLFKLLNDGLFVALGSAMFSLLGVYIASAAYRAFRIKSVESSVMMIAALVVMLGQIPFGLWIYDDLPAWRLWLLSWPNSAAFRAITLGASVAGLVLSIRMWLSLGQGGEDA